MAKVKQKKRRVKKVDWLGDLWEIYKKFYKEMKKFVTVIKIKETKKLEEELSKI